MNTTLKNWLVPPVLFPAMLVVLIVVYAACRASI